MSLFRTMVVVLKAIITRGGLVTLTLKWVAVLKAIITRGGLVKLTLKRAAVLMLVGMFKLLLIRVVAIL